MTLSLDDRRTLDALEVRLRVLLPEEYQDSYEDVEPNSMGSAGLKYGFDGKVAWDEMWGAFCDLAMAGGPPHKGTLLEPASRAVVAAQANRYGKVLREVRRGIMLVTGLHVRESPTPGWIRVTCFSRAMAGWLLRAIVMENVAARATSRALDLPLGPDYRLEKEMKNVITVIAKTCHYWLGHTPCAQQRAIADLLLRMESESPLIVPGAVEKMVPGASAPVGLSRAIERATGLKAAHHQYRGWLGVECPTARAAIWMMRMMVASNALSRREGTVLFLPVNDVSDAGGEIVTRLLTRVHRFAAARSIV
jgi:sirohydrochlorin cobaltochelatase